MLSNILKTKAAAFILAMSAAACSWFMPVRVPDHQNSERLAACSALPATVDTLATGGYGLAIGLMALMPSNEPECTSLDCIGAGVDKAIPAIILLGAIVIQGAAAITGWIRYGSCCSDLADRASAVQERLVPQPEMPPLEKSPAAAEAPPGDVKE